MNQDHTKRKLSAILSADVVGYSRLMEADEAWTIQNLEDNKKLISSIIEERNGRVVDAPGDNILAEFNSVINAVECAVKIQNKLNYKNSNLLEERRMHFRIGVNLGDVVEEDGRIYGNGVNMSARLEGLAEPGGICISHNAYDQVKSKVNVEYDYLGEYQVKNINEPVRVYRILMEGESSEKYVLHGKSQKMVTPLNIAIAIIFLLIATLGITFTTLYQKPLEPRQVTRFYYELPEDQQFRDLRYYPALAISPDGSKFVYATNKGLFLRSMEKLPAKLIPGTEGPTTQPFFSPDGKWIGYISGPHNKLKKIAINGGLPVDLADVPDILGYISWGADDMIVYGGGRNIMKISADGGNPEIFIDGKGENPVSPQVLPDARSVLYTNIETRPEKMMIYSLDSGKRKELDQGWIIQYLPTGHLVYGFQDNYAVRAIPFDLDRLDFTGEAHIVEGVKYGQMAISDSGTLVYVPGTGEVDLYKSGLRTFVWVDREGKEEPLTAKADYYNGPRISPDGMEVALSIGTYPDADIWIWDIIRKSFTKRLTLNEKEDFQPIWSPDGDWIAFFSYRDGKFGIYRKRADGTGEAELLFSKPEYGIYPWSWLPHKEGFVLFEADWIGSNRWDIGELSMEGDKKCRFVLKEEPLELQPAISPDGKWMAYFSDETGLGEVYVRSFPDIDKHKVQISTGGGNSPLWAPNGKELFYLTGDAVMRVSVNTEQTIKVGKPEILFSGSYAGYIPQRGTPWDIDPNGKRFLMMKPYIETAENSKDQSSCKINIVLNWFEELKEKVPTD